MTYTVNCSILLTELPLLERPAAAKAAGFDAVEFWWPFETSVPSDAEVTAFENAITDAGVQLTGLNFNAGNMPGGDRGLVSWKGRCSEFKDNIDVVAGIGERLGCKAFNALYGNRAGRVHPPRSRTNSPSRTWRPRLKAWPASAAPSSSSPSAAHPRYPLLTADDALKVIARVKAESGADEHQAPRRLLPPGSQRGRRRSRHRKPRQGLRPHPDRRQPRPRGSRNRQLPLGEWIARSRELGYEGYIGLEYKEPQETAFSWAIRQRASRLTPSRSVPRLEPRHHQKTSEREPS